MAYSLRDRLPPPPKYFTFYDPGAYQYERSTKCTPNKVPFNSSKPRNSQAARKIWTHTMYDVPAPGKITNCTAMLSKVPRFPYEALSKEDIEEILCRCGFPNPCECPIEEQEEEPTTCHAKVPRRLFKGAAPPPLVGSGLSTPSKGDHGFEFLPDGSAKRIKEKVLNESPPFYDPTVNEFTKFYYGCKWSKQTSKRSSKLLELSPGPANYILLRTPTFFELCSQKFRSYKRRTSKQLRFIEMVQQRNISENLPGPASYLVKYPKCTDLQYLGPKAKRFSVKKYDEAPGPADYSLRRDFDVTDIPELFCHAKLPKPSCFGVKDRRFKPLKEVGPSPASYSPTYKPCNFMKCSKAPFGHTAKRFKEDIPQDSDDEIETAVPDQEEENKKKPCEIPTWQFKSKSKRFEMLIKKPNEPSPADLRQPRIKIERSRQLQYIAPFFASEGRFQPWFDWMPVFGRVKTPGPCKYKLDKPKCNTAVRHGPLSRAARFSSYERDSPAPNEYNVGRGIETILATHNVRLKTNIENQHKFIWEPPIEPEQLSFEEREAYLLNKSIALLDVENSTEEKPNRTASVKSSVITQDKKNRDNKLLRSFLHSRKVDVTLLGPLSASALHPPKPSDPENMNMSRLGALHTTGHTGSRHTATMIFFHGSGSSGGDMREWVKLLMKTFSFPHIKIVYPTAPMQPYTPAGGMMSNVWFDRADISPVVPEKLDSVNEMEMEVKNLIKNEHIAGIPSNRIIVGGFSMGGALAFHTGYRWDRNLAGVFAFSSFLNENSIIYRELQNSPGIKTPPLLQIHGDSDDLVETRWGQETFDALTSLGVKGEFHIMEILGHSINRRGLAVIKSWAENILPEE